MRVTIGRCLKLGFPTTYKSLNFKKKLKKVLNYTN